MAGGRTAVGLLVLVCLHFHRCSSFNLDDNQPFVYSGPERSYFGFSVDFFKPDNTISNVLIGAPRANTSSVSRVVERGAVYSCPWKTISACQQLEFDNSDDRTNSDGVQMEFKSKQWFGASVRSDGQHILACAPLYQWSTFGVSEREPVGTCFLKKGSKVVEYSPCRSSANSPEGQGFCQAGFSADLIKNKRVVLGGPGSFYWQGQLISDDVSEIFTRFDSKFVTPYGNTLATRSAGAQYDDSYLGYSVTVGDFNGDGKEDYVTGVPRGDKALGYVNIFNGPNMESMINFTGSQMAAYFGHSVAASDVNNDGFLDLLVGAPLFMDRGSDGKLREVGQVSVFLGRSGFSFQPPQLLTGSEVYARYGSSIAAVGDLNRDGYNDVAISAPYGGPDHYGLVYIHNGRSKGPNPSPSQVLQGKWASSYMPASFGYSMTGNTDIDQNGYPDLLVGVFGADKAVLYRARPVIGVNATLDITPQIINPEDKTCKLPGTNTDVSCFKVKYCLTASGVGAPTVLTFQVDLMLDRLKQKETTKRVLFLHSRSFQYSKNMTVTNDKRPACEELDVFLRDDREFRDKITPISVAMEYNLDYKKAADQTGLQPILDMSAPSNVTKQAHILLDCGEDNICKPDLKLSVKSDSEQLYIGDDNALTLEVSAENQGEGAYEAELHVFPPQQADFTGVGRSQAFSRLSCAYKKENQTKIVVCDLGNPMKGGTKILAELKFSVHQLSEEDTSVKFDLQIVSSNQFESTSPRVSSITKLAVLAKVSIRGSSSPSQVLLPIANWKPKEPPVVGDDIGPQIVHVYELLNNGPSTFSKASLEVEWPYHYRNGSLLYITSFDTEGPINCTTDIEINPLNVSNPLTSQNNISVVPPREREGEGRNRNHVRKRDLESKESHNDLYTLDCATAACLRLKCQVGRLERTKNAILFIYSRLTVNNFLRTENQNRSYVVRSTASFSVIEMPYKNLVSELASNTTTVSLSVVWVAEGAQSVPGWVVALAVLAGLLLLALLIFIMYKLGFFNRVRPPQEDCTEKEQLQPEENGNTDA
ncbi:integrin alpha-V [Melanotaenia boesemani]|uniref:integrin alpha-V n=1 Tax=Melanotaenia boesemani TaxID=1250792 RepID=UPI001C03B1AD|nr:integrin alpha-V [Melanotaenia boesemani]XP_041857615.1 integrin alpha-V [Melanotaenia boesemani]XP_041857616.1 integrin alpha-V [Melanotaenia boesemani]XP_041857617.1 integrin alpha-V [Melanotaenia boesemani]